MLIDVIQNKERDTIKKFNKKMRKNEKYKNVA